MEAEIANYEACLKEEVEKRKKFKVCWWLVCIADLAAQRLLSGVVLCTNGGRVVQLRMAMRSIQSPFPVTKQPSGAVLSPGQTAALGSTESLGEGDTALG